MKKLISAFMTVVFACTLFLGIAPVAKAATTFDFHAYLCIQTNNTLWTFRNAIDDANYGLGTDEFDGGLYSTKTKIHYAGTFTDAAITKDGTYTVTLDNPDFAGETTMSQLFVSTDIPMSSYLKVTNVIVKVDGNSLYTFDNGMLNPESYNIAQIMCMNVWNPDVAALFSNNVPTSKVEITFTVSGIAKAVAEKESLKDFTFKMAKDHAGVSGYTGSAASVKLPTNAFAKTVTEISDKAFQNSSVKSVTIPDTVTKIGNYSFAGTKFTSITIPKGVTTIGNGAFSSCISLTKLTLAKGNSSFVVKDGVLYSKDMKTLVQYLASNKGTSFTVPSSVTTIQASAFEGCTKLTKVTIPKTVTKIGKDAFKDCSKVTIYAPSGSTAYKYATDNKIKVKNG